MRIHGVVITSETIEKAIDIANNKGALTHEGLSKAFRVLGVPEVSGYTSYIPEVAATRVINKLKKQGKIEKVHYWKIKL